MSAGELGLVVSVLVQIADDLRRVARTAAALGPNSADFDASLLGSRERGPGLADALGRTFDGALERAVHRLEAEASTLACAVEHILWLFETTDEGLAQLVMGPDRHLGVVEP